VTIVFTDGALTAGAGMTDRWIPTKKISLEALRRVRDPASLQ
jgi:hypothetical protein